MKLLLSLTTLTVIVLFIGCRKEEPAVLPENGVMGEAHCLNGIMDGDEDGVDCGPSCEPCALSLADCSITSPPGDNTFKTTGGVNLSFASGSVVADSSTGVLIITATVGSSEVVATFSSASPTVFAAYDVVNLSPGPNEVRLHYNNGGPNYNGYSDLLHLNRINGKLSIEFCDVYMSVPAGGYTIASGKLTEN